MILKVLDRRERLTLALLVFLLLCIIAISSSVIYFSEREERIDEMRHHAEHELKLISLVITEALTKGDYSTVESFMSQWASDSPELVEATLVSRSGFILASHVTSKVAKRRLEFNKEIQYGDQGSMELRVIWDVAPVFDDLNILIAVLLFTHIVTMLIVLLFLWWVLRRTLLDPLHSELNESEDYSRLLFEESPVGLALCRLNGELVDVNKAFSELLGRTKKEVMSLSYWDITPEKYSTDEQRQLELLKNTGRYGPYEKEYIHKDGHRMPVRLKGALIEKGGETFIWSSVEDITEQNRMNEEIKGAQRQLQNLLNDMQTMTAILALDGTMTFINEAPLKMLGLSEADVLGHKVWDGPWVNYSPDAQQRVKDDCKKAAGGEIVLHDLQIYTLTGLLWIEFSVFPILDDKGNVKQLVAEGRDISLRKQAEDDLTEQRDFNTAVVESAGNVIVILDTNGCIVTFNTAAEKLTGYNREELLGKPVWDWVIPEEQIDAVRNVFDNLIDGDIDMAGQYTNDWVMRDGSRRTLDWHNTVLKDKDGVLTHVVALGYDITQRLQVENELKQLNSTLETRVEQRTRELKTEKEKAERANQSKTNFLSNMSHEIRSPLAAVIGFSESLITDVFDEEQRTKILSTIVRNGKHLQLIVNDILDLAKIEADQVEVELIDTSVFMLMAEIDSLLGMSARDKGLEFKINYHFPLPEKIVTDPTLFKQIIINLCNNAIKFTIKGQVVVDVRCDADYKQLELSVTDTGIGMTPDEASRIFDPFSQADSSTTRKYGGTGLGLSISDKLASALDGELRCISTVGEGSCFMLTIANQNDDVGLVINNLEKVGINFNDLRYQPEVKALSGKILLVDDSPDNQQLISMYISKTGADFKIAENGRQAVKLAMAEDFDLILMDMQMPVMDGIEAIRLLRATGYKHPIVSLTANALISDREKCEAAGADGYLVKPIELNQFYDVLNKYLKEDITKNGIEKNDGLQEKLQYKALAQRFRANLPDLLEELNVALTGKNWGLLQVKTHDLKGMGGAMGYPEITEIAARLNALTRKKSYAQLDDVFLELKTYCDSISRE